MAVKLLFEEKLNFNDHINKICKSPATLISRLQNHREGFGYQFCLLKL